MFARTRAACLCVFIFILASCGGGGGSGGGADGNTPTPTPNSGSTPTVTPEATPTSLPPYTGPLPVIEFTSPNSLTTLGTQSVEVEGTIAGYISSEMPSEIIIQGNIVPIIEQENNVGSFSASLNLEEGNNVIGARYPLGGARVAINTLSVSVDLTPPYITIESHTNGQVVYVNTIDVTGLVNDIVRGTVQEHQASVMVNNQTAVVNNRTYIAENIPLEIGDNLLTITATDQAGNVSTNSTVTVRYEPSVNGQITIVSGDKQSALINAELPEPITVRVTDQNGDPISNKPVIFQVIQGAGIILESENQDRGWITNTDESGEASASIRLGLRAGVGNQKVKASVVGVNQEAIFHFSATTNSPKRINVNSGLNQRGATGQPLPMPFVVTVTDEGANPVKDQRVRFEVTQGDSLFNNNENTIEAVTDSDGRANANLILGDLVGLDVHRITATIPDTPYSSSFSASAFEMGDPGQTSIKGTVLDNQDAPLPNVTISVEGSNRVTTTNEQGQFTITEAPVGPVHLFVDGSTTTAEGEWPTLSFDIVTVPGAENPMAAPIYLVKLAEKAVLAGEQDVEITIDEVPGFKLEVKANSVTFPDGSKTGYLSATPVNFHKLPMAPPDGSLPRFVVTVQPSGTRFDPPAKFTIPNTQGLAAGTQIDFFSYDHDLEEWASVGLATVSEDATVIVANNGVGLVKAGWTGDGRPTDTGDLTSCGNDCVEEPNDLPPEQLGPQDGPQGHDEPIPGEEEEAGERGINNDEPDCYLVDNPINIVNGNKFQKEIQHKTKGAFPIVIGQIYNSSLGKWRHTHQYHLRTWKNAENQVFAEMRIPDGNVYNFPVGETSGALTGHVIENGVYEATKDAFVNLEVSDTSEGKFVAKFKNQTQVVFNASRALSKVSDGKGNEHNYSYERQENDTWKIAVASNSGDQVELFLNADEKLVRAVSGSTEVDYTFDENRNLTSLSGNRSVVAKQFSYNDVRFPNHLTGISTASGAKIGEYSYDNYGRAVVTNSFVGLGKTKVKKLSDGSTEVENENGLKTNYQFAEYRGRLKMTNVQQQEARYTPESEKSYDYYENGLPRIVTSESGKRTLYEYNERGLETRIVENYETESESVKTITWHSTYNKPTEIAENGLVTRFTYDGRERITSVDIGGRTWSYEYNNFNKITNIDGPRDDVKDTIQLNYDEAGNLSSKVNGLGHTVSYFDYNEFDKPTRMVDENNVETTYSYNERGKLVSTIVHSTQGQAETQFGYDENHYLNSVTTATDIETIFENDQSGKITKITNENKENVNITYTKSGKLEQVTFGTEPVEGEPPTAAKLGVANLYTEANKPRKVIDGSGNDVSLDYNAIGKVSRLTDANKNDTQYFYDANKDLTRIQYSDGTDAEYGRNAQGEITSYTDRRNHETTFTKNALGETISQTNPDTGTTSYTYDEAGNLTSKTDARGVVASYSYDALNRLTSIQYSDDESESVTFEYDEYFVEESASNYGVGKLTRISDESGVTSYVYDDRGNLIEERFTFAVGENQHALSTLYTYDLDNKITSVTTPSGVIINYTYDDVGRMSTISTVDQNNAPKEIVRGISYSEAGKISGMEWGNGIQMSRTFNDAHKVVNQTTSNGVQNINYTYDRNGNITSINESIAEPVARVFEYDDFNQIISESSGTSRIEYQYDALGNRLEKIQFSLVEDEWVEGSRESSRYSENGNRMIQDNGESVNYDTAGNVLNIDDLTFAYSSSGRLENVVSVGGLNKSYKYRGSGERVLVLSSVDGVYDYYSYDQNGSLLEVLRFNENGVISKIETAYFVGYKLVASRVLLENEERFYYAHEDAVNRPDVLTGELGQVDYRFNLNTFGEGGSDSPVILSLPGKIFEEDVNVYYNYARYYFPKWGRYTQADPLGQMISNNLYVHTENNPLAYIDIDGKEKSPSEDPGYVSPSLPPMVGKVFKTPIGRLVKLNLKLAKKNIEDFIHNRKVEQEDKNRQDQANRDLAEDMRWYDQWTEKEKRESEIIKQRRYEEESQQLFQDMQKRSEEIMIHSCYLNGFERESCKKYLEQYDDSCGGR